jgi:molybdopterin converting factor small subunit
VTGVAVTIRLPGVLRELAGGARTVRLDVDGGTTLREVLDRLAAEYPALERRIRDERGVLRRHVNVFLGDANVRDGKELDTEVRPGAELYVIPAVSGG